jgi:hypothetical protein
MWAPRRLTTLWDFTACYINSFTSLQQRSKEAMNGNRTKEKGNEIEKGGLDGKKKRRNRWKDSGRKDERSRKIK